MITLAQQFVRAATDGEREAALACASDLSSCRGHTGKAFRSGFTLIELLVVLSLIVILASLTVAFLPNAFNSATEAKAATLVQSWLNTARQRALRDQAPRGLRLWIGTTLIGAQTLNNVVTQCQYIEKPDDYSPLPPIPPSPGNPGNPGGLQIISDTPLGAPANSTRLNTIAFFMPGTLTGATYPHKLKDNTNTLRNGLAYNPTEVQFWQVQPNDYIEIGGNGLLHKIIAMPVVVGFPDYVMIDPPLAYPIVSGQQTFDYRIQRRPRTMGNDFLDLPEGTVIDVSTNLGTTAVFAKAGVNNPLPWDNSLPVALAPIPPAAPIAQGYYVDILFSPTGNVITPNVHTQTMNLWVRAPSEQLNPAPWAPDVYRPIAPVTEPIGLPTIIAVHVQTGLVAAYAPGPSNNPYVNVR